MVGFDLVELCPLPGIVAPNFLCAKLIYKILSYRFGGEVGRRVNAPPQRTRMGHNKAEDTVSRENNRDLPSCSVSSVVALVFGG